MENIVKNLLATTASDYTEEDNFFFTAQLGDYRSTLQHDVETNEWGIVHNGDEYWFSTMGAAIHAEVNSALRMMAETIDKVPFISYDEDGIQMEVQPRLYEDIEYVFKRTAFFVCKNEEDALVLERLLEALDYGKVEHHYDTPANDARVYIWQEAVARWQEADSHDAMAKYFCKKHFA